MTGIVAGSRPRPSASVSPVYDIAERELIAFAERLGLDKIVTGTEADDAARKRLCLGDRDALASFDAAELTTAEIAAAERAEVHNTEFELLWIQYDPEYPLYEDALRNLKRESATNPDTHRYLVRKPGWLDGIDTFSVKAVADPSKPYAEFNDPDEDVIAVALAGVVRACKK